MNDVWHVRIEQHGRWSWTACLYVGDSPYADHVYGWTRAGVERKVRRKRARAARRAASIVEFTIPSGCGETREAP